MTKVQIGNKPYLLVCTFKADLFHLMVFLKFSTKLVIFIFPTGFIL
jgi:hypothetical protein